MPELPEVETTIRYLTPFVIGHKITHLQVLAGDYRHFNSSVENLQKELIDQSFLDLTRHGKWMIWHLSSGKFIVSHLRMSGRFLISKPDAVVHPHLRFSISLQNQTTINYIDQRRFGTFHLVNSLKDYQSLNKLGPDALHGNISAEYLYSQLQKTKKPVYSALLDQSVIAGLGNIYVNEALNLSKIHPLKPSNLLSMADCQNIILNAQQVLNKSLSMRGTTLIDNLFQDPEGKTGEFSKMLTAYGKSEKDGFIKLKIGGRTAYVDKSLQIP